MSAAVPPLTLRPAIPGDRFLLNRWLVDPEVIGWFGSRAAADATLSLARETPSALSRIIAVGTTAIGYAQALELDPGSQVATPLMVGTVELDAFVGDAAWRGRGYGARAFGLLRDEVFTTTLAPAVVVRVPITREEVVRRIEKVGFAWVSVENDSQRGPCWLLSAERP
jgi:RimJ/RimL family protein N-acetyltransferase